jgi:hypothetical protein
MADLTPASAVPECKYDALLTSAGRCVTESQSVLAVAGLLVELPMACSQTFTKLVLD